MSALLASAFVAAGLVAAPDELGPSVERELDVRVVALVEDGVFADDELLDALLVLGPPALEAAWSVGFGYASAPGADRDLDDLWPALLEEGRHLRVVEALYAVLPEQPGYAALTHAVDVLASRGEVASIPVVCDLAARLSGSAVRSQRTRSWFTDRLFELERGAPAEARPLLAEGRPLLPTRLVGAVDLALLDAGDASPLAHLRTARGDEPELVHVLRGIRGLRTDLPQTEQLIDTLEELLRSREDRVRALAVECLASRGASRFTETWVRLTGDWSPQVRRAARLALARTTGVRWPVDVDGWESWWATESAWIDEELPGLVDALRGADRAEQVRALRLLLQHPAAAHLYVPELESRLLDPDTECAVRCVGALGALRDPGARRLLVEATSDRRDPVRHAATRSLAARAGA